VCTNTACALVLWLALAGCDDERPASSNIDEPAVATPRGDITPRIEQRAEGPMLVLPSRMQEAVLTAVPRFRHTPLSDFHPDIVQFAPPTERSAPFAAIGDFNGDGRADVVVEGRDSRRSLLLVLLTEGDSVRVVRLKERSVVLDQGMPRGEYLSLVKRGVIQADTIDGDGYEKVSVRLERDAFELVYWQKASVLHYWRNGRFVEWATSD